MWKTRGSMVGVGDSAIHCENQSTFSGFKDIRGLWKVGKGIDSSRKSPERNSALPTHCLKFSEIPFRIVSYKTIK